MTNPQRRTIPDIPGYEITRLIGLGGMGEVHLARQVALNRPVAIKFLTRTTSDPTDDYEARFRREAELMARISHPNVVTIYEFGSVAGRPYLVMEYVEGGDLRSKMVPDVPMDISQIRAIMKPVLKAVEHLHSQGIVHRDMKPENILMLREETPKVTDFGIAVLDFAMGSLTRTGLSLGTPGYVAPEQQYGLKVDARADQFSLAALCYEMATGRKPLGAFPPPEKLNPRLGKLGGSVIFKALSDDPADRYATIGEFGEALDGVLEAAEAGRPSKRRWPVAVAAVAGLSALIGVSALILWLLPGPPPVPKDLPVNPGPAIVRTPIVPQGVPGPLPRRGDEASRLTVASAGLTLVKIPAGTFEMGSSPEETGSQPEERPRHRVRISQAFYLGETEVTVAQFRKYTQANPNSQTSAEMKPPDGGKSGGCLFDLHQMKLVQRPELNWKNPGGDKPQFDNEPVVQVSWYDAVAFCNWLTSQEGRPFRLPTEAEWEYACRARTTTLWSHGDDPAMLNQFAWTLNNAGNTFHPVGTKKPNAFGLFDMHGNAWEWCLDEFGPYDAAARPADDPQGPPYGGERVLRGGSFDWENVQRTRSASRYKFPPYMSYYNYGFRVCSPAP